MKNLRKFFAVSVMALTIFAMSGISPVKASAQAGDLIKKDGLSTVYYLGADGKRYVFPNDATYFSWHKDFSGVVTVSATELSSYPLGANIVIRPGTKLVKITTDPSVYAVEANGVLRKIQSESDAIALYGSNWAKRVVDVADSFFTNYTIGTPLPTGTVPAGSLVKTAGAATIYYFDGSTYRSIATEAAFNANRFDFSNVITVSAIGTLGTPVAGAEEMITKDSQGGATGPVVTGSNLMVSLSSATPAAASVPQNGARVPFTKVNLTAANDGAVSVNSITVKRIGLSSYTNVDKVWAEKDGVVVAAKKSMNSNDESILTFVPALTVGAGQTVSLDIIASLTGTGAGNIGLGVASASMVSASAASVTGSFPVNGNLMSPTSYNVVNLYISSTSTAATTVKVGDEKVELAKVGLDFNGTAKDAVVKSITLKNSGVEDLATAAMNLYLEYNGNKVSESTVVNGRYVTFNMPAAGFDMLKDDGQKIFYVKGDVVSKANTATDSFTFTVNKSTDVVVIEKATGFGANVYTTSNGTTAADAYPISSVTIDAGALSVSKKTTSPSDTTIIKGSDNVVLLANIRADEAIIADGLKLIYGSNLSNATTSDQFENVRVYVNGNLLDSFDPASSTSALITESIDSNVSLNKGDNEVKVMVKAKSNAAAASAFMAKLDGTTIFTGMNGEYVSSGNAIAAPSGSATGAIFTVQGANLTTVRNDGYANGKIIVRGGTDVSLGKFTLKAGNDSVKVTSIALASSTGTTSASYISDMKLFVDGVQVGSTVDFGSTGATFSSLNFTIAKDATKSVELKGSFDSSAAGAANGFQTVMTINAQDSRGTTVTGPSITGTTVQFAISEQGSLTLALNGDTPSAGMLATNASEHEVAQFKFTSIDDSANLTEITLGNYATSGAAVTTSTDPRISAIKLYDGATLIDSFVPVNGAGTFTISDNKVSLAANTQKVLSVKVVLNNIVNDSTATDKDLRFMITDYQYKTSAGTLVDTPNQTVIANNFRIRKTVPTVALMTLPDTTLNAGNKVVSKFTVTADANADVTLRKVVLTYATTSQATIATLPSNAVKVNGSTKTASSTVDAALKTITLAFGTEEVIAAGTTKTFEILATVGVSGTGSDSITTSIVEDASYATTGSFEWSDNASISTPTWSNGHTVKGLTTDTQVLSK